MKDLHYLIIGILLGFGAAIPIGPINLEMIRRHLTFGGLYAFSFGLGACIADVTYLCLLTFGILAFLTFPLILKIIAILGAIILIWFGIRSFRIPKFNSKNPHTPIAKQQAMCHTSQAYMMTLINPMTILFWSSVSTQISLFAKHKFSFAIYSGIGVLLGTLSWITFLNLVIHYTKHFLSNHVIHLLNILGGIILIFFALFGMAHAFHFL